MEIQEVDAQMLGQCLEKIFDQQTLEAGLPKVKDQVIALAALEGGQIIGGIVAKQTHESIYVQLLAVDNNYRGKRVGSQLLEAIETYARQRAIIQLTLTTKSYQALGFYQKKGFDIFGELADMPMRGVTKYYLNKRLQA